MKNQIRSPAFPHRLAAGLAMVLLAVIWATGWFTPPDPFVASEKPLLMMLILALVFVAWNLLSCAVAAGFFHAASKHPASTFRAYRNASLRLVILAVLFLFPIPIAAQVLGSSPGGRALSLFVTLISLAGVVFGRTRLNLIELRLLELASGSEPQPKPELLPSLAPFEEVNEFGENHSKIKENLPET